MRYFLDTEFFEDGHTIMPISLALVAEDGRELYLEFAFDKRKVETHPDPWVKENVLPQLMWPPDIRVSRRNARSRLIRFFNQELGDGAPKPQIWAYHADYDWVLFAQLFGRMVDLPDWMPKHCMDLKQLFLHLGEPYELKPPPRERLHNAMDDARWDYQFFQGMAPLARAKGLVL
jgi:hypothetical protein